MKTLVFANQKGGVGKSAIATQLAHYLYRQGRSVVVIDLDHQQNTSRPLQSHSSVTAANFTSSAIFTDTGHRPLPDSRFVLVSGDDQLSTLERQPVLHNSFASRFRAALTAWSHFDVCIIDTNPNPDIRYASALISANFVLAPIQLNQEAIEGITALLGHPRYGTIRIESALNPDLKLLGILPNMVEATPFQKANLQLLISKFGSRLLSRRVGGDLSFGYIQKRTAMAEAQAGGQFLADMSKTSARDTWREVKPVFDMIIDGMGLASVMELSA